jgi:2-keto-4-pentenoate hydratase
VGEIDPRLASALSAQLGHWRAALADGAGRVGWKLGMGDRERIGRGPVIGYLTTASALDSGATYVAGDASALHADAEVALEMGADLPPDADLGAAGAAIARYGAALEIVDLGGPDEPEAIVADNVFHRAVVLTGWQPALPASGVEGRLIVSGELRASATSPTNLADRVLAVAHLLGAMGERLRAGDRIITGSVVQIPVRPGDEVTADLGPLGAPRLAIAR